MSDRQCLYCLSCASIRGLGLGWFYYHVVRGVRESVFIYRNFKTQEVNLHNSWLNTELSRRKEKTQLGLWSFIGVVLSFQTQHQGERNSLLTRAARKDSQSKKRALCFDHQIEESAAIVLWTVTLWEVVLAKNTRWVKTMSLSFCLEDFKTPNARISLLIYRHFHRQCWKM